MPPKARITKEMIIDAAFAVVRRSGVDEINVRKIAAELGCSTQPVMYHFRTMEELKSEVFDKSVDFSMEYSFKDDPDSIEELCLRYIRFANEEHNLFRFIYQTGRVITEKLKEYFECEKISKPITNFMNESGMTRAQAGSMISTLFLTIHGYCSLVANGCVEYDEGAARSILENALASMTPYWKTLDR